MSDRFTLSTAVEKFLDWANRHLRRRTVVEYTRYLRRFVRHVGDVDVAVLRAHHLVDWGSTWHRIQAVQRCFNWLVEVEYIERSPFNKIKRPRLGKRKRTFTRKEFSTLARAAARDFREFLFAMRESLARPQEVRAIQWTELHNADDSLPLEQALPAGRCYILQEEYKARDRRADPDEARIIPINRRLGRMICRIMRRTTNRSGEIFRTRRRRAWTKEAVRNRMKRARAKLGWQRDHRGEQLVAYSIRHTGGTAYTVAGVRDKMLAAIMGHANTRTTARYQHPQPNDVLNAMEAMTPKKEMRPKVR